jgi:signal transduction histidine kinase
MTKGITRQLILYFILVIVSFAIVIGFVFGFNVRRQTRESIEVNLLSRSNLIANLIAENRSFDIDKKVVEDYLSSVDLDDLQVWVVSNDGEINTITETRMGMGMMRNYYSLNKSTQDLLTKVLKGEQLVSDRIKGVFDVDTMTVGTPIKINDQVVGALFISASLSSIDALSTGSIRTMLIALSIGILIAIALGYFLSLNFIKPLMRANQAVNTLALGQYDVHIDDSRGDEIGLLAKNINSLAKRLEDASRQSENLEKMRQNFIADITHELRTPVTIIRGLAEGIKDKVYDISESPLISTQIIHETVGMQRLIQDLLDLSKLEDPDFQLDMRALELHEVLQDVSRSAHALLDAKKQHLILDIQEGEWNIIGDQQRLKQMFIAVIDNASKFSTINQNIELKAEKIDDTVRVSIKDNGVGISELQQKELFKRYKKDSQNNPNGNGLGLLIVSRIASNHTIELSVKNKGTVKRIKDTEIVFKIN